MSTSPAHRGHCFTCGDVVGAGAGLCAGCRQALYCSAACQSAHWQGGHAVQCAESQRLSAPTVPPASCPQPPFAPTLAAAHAGDALAMYLVAGMYGSGTGVAQSFASAFEWYTRCAAQAHPPRELWGDLGDCYYFGRGVPVDATEAARHYYVGAAAGDAFAQCQLASSVGQGLGVPAPDFGAAVALYTAAAAQGHPGAYYGLGCCYSRGEGVARDLPRAVTLWESALAHPAVSAGTAARAAFNLGVVHGRGEHGVPVDAARAEACMRRAAAMGHETAQRCLREAGLVGDTGEGDGGALEGGGSPPPQPQPQPQQPPQQPPPPPQQQQQPPSPPTDGASGSAGCGVM